MSWIQTYKGVRFDLWRPRPEDVRIVDIAHALSNICRFGGHVNEFYSVAQHSVIVSYLLPQEWALAGLLHDAAEAYAGDVVRPLKASLGGYEEIEHRIERAIWRRFAIDPTPECLAAVKHADEVALATEARDLLGGDRSDWAKLPEPLPSKIVPWGSQEAAQNYFHMRFMELALPLPAATYLREELEALLAQVDCRPLAELRDLAGSNWGRGADAGEGCGFGGQGGAERRRDRETERGGEGEKTP